MYRWEGKVAIVTGASSGIGAAVTQDLAEAGLKVVAVARRLTLLEEKKEALKNVKGEIHPFQADVSNVSEIPKLFEWVKTKFGTVHILINNAGISRAGGVEDGNLQDMIDVVNTNFVGLLACTQAALRLMREAGVDDGHIINVNSLYGHIVPSLELLINIYPATKFAITGLTEILRQELMQKNSKIRVTSISPGYVKTDIINSMITKSDPNAVKSVIDRMSTFRKAKRDPALYPKDISSAILYSLSVPPHVQIHEMIIRPLHSLI